jgi:hypothetical protein
MSGNIFGQSTKESYRSDIEDSLKQKTVYKNYEYFDDYSYGNSEKIGFWLTKQNNKQFLYLFQSDGPKTVDNLKKVLEWRRSGSSKEIGHKGGGNKRNIYGFKSQKTSIFSKLDENDVLFCETTPNKLYDLSLSDIDEQSFRNISDSSQYIKSPEQIEIQDLPAWYSDTYKEIHYESNIEPNYLMRMELTEIPEEYNIKQCWDEYINQVRAKQYDIPIYFKNDLIEMENYENYENIDFIGFNDKDKISEKILPLYIHKTEYSFFVKDDNSHSNYVNLKNKETTTNSDEFYKWGLIQMFIVSNIYIKQELDKYNLNLDQPQTLKYEDAYGVYLKINNKLTNYLPIEGKLLGESKNNGIYLENGQKNNSRFRMIFIPDNYNCLIESKYFDSLIQTETIKALSGFLHKSPYKPIIKNALDIYKGRDIFPISESKSKSKPKKKNKDVKTEGAVYIIYLGYDLFKFGYVSNFNRLSERINEHKRDSIKMVHTFLDITMNYPNIVPIFNIKTTEPKGIEEKISNLLQEDKYYNDIELFENKNSKNDIREYFKCNIDYLIQNIIPRLEIEN